MDSDKPIIVFRPEDFDLDAATLADGAIFDAYSGHSHLSGPDGAGCVYAVATVAVPGASNSVVKRGRPDGSWELVTSFTEAGEGKQGFGSCTVVGADLRLLLSTRIGDEQVQVARWVRGVAEPVAYVTRTELEEIKALYGPLERLVARNRAILEQSSDKARELAAILDQAVPG